MFRLDGSAAGGVRSDIFRFSLVLIDLRYGFQSSFLHHRIFIIHLSEHIIFDSKVFK
jgi:hypothetical protein